MMALPCIDILDAVTGSPNIIGYGIEIVATIDMKILLEKTGEDFEMQYFTSDELSIAKSRVQRLQYLAGRYCAKKAILKALGIELHHWLDVEVQRLPTGKPSVVLYGQYQEVANRLGIARWLLSISHVPDYAAASAIALNTI